MSLQTSAGQTYFQSINKSSFNLMCEDSLPRPPLSVFPARLLTDKGRSFFEIACQNIGEKKYTPLCEAMIAKGCNKPTAHNYTVLYHNFLSDYRASNLKFVEVGIGSPNQDVPSAMGQNYPFGSSLRGWRSYFHNPETKIYGADIDPRVLFEEERISTRYLNQLNPSSIVAFVEQLKLSETGIDFFLDDGLHKFSSNITLLLCAWPFIRTNGLYVVEDIAANTYKALLSFLEELALGADCYGFELPSSLKSDNRVIFLQKKK